MRTQGVGSLQRLTEAGNAEGAVMDRGYDVRMLRQAHALSANNAVQLSVPQRCGCFYCCSSFSSTEIEEWIDDERGATAVCPHCGVDAVIGKKPLFPLTDDFLEAMHEYWIGALRGKEVIK